MKLPPSTFLTTLIVLAIASLAANSTFAEQNPKTKTPVIKASNAKELKANIGNKVSVEGKVTSVAKGPKDKMRFLNFGKSEKTGFTAALVPAVYPKFENLDRMVNERVRVTGKLETYKKKSVIKVTRPAQVKILEPKKAKTTKKEKKATE